MSPTLHVEASVKSQAPSSSARRSAERSPRSPATSPTPDSPAASRASLPLLIEGDPHDGAVAERPQVGETSRHLDPVAPPEVSDHRRDHMVPGLDELLRLRSERIQRSPPRSRTVKPRSTPYTPRCGPIDRDQSSSQSGAASFSNASGLPGRRRQGRRGRSRRSAATSPIPAARRLRGLARARERPHSGSAFRRAASTGEQSAARSRHPSRGADTESD